MRKCLLQVNELQSFIMCSAKENSFATICAEQDAAFQVDGTVPLFTKFCTYDNKTVQRILSQANMWQIKVNITEDWDPSFGHTQGRVKKKHIVFFLKQFADMDYSDIACQKRLIETFVNSVFRVLSFTKNSRYP